MHYYTVSLSGKFTDVNTDQEGGVITEMLRTVMRTVIEARRQLSMMSSFGNLIPHCTVIGDLPKVYTILTSDPNRHNTNVRGSLS